MTTDLPPKGVTVLQVQLFYFILFLLYVDFLILWFISPEYPDGGDFSVIMLIVSIIAFILTYTSIKGFYNINNRDLKSKMLVMPCLIIELLYGVLMLRAFIRNPSNDFLFPGGTLLFGSLLSLISIWSIIYLALFLPLHNDEILNSDKIIT